MANGAARCQPAAPEPPRRGQVAPLRGHRHPCPGCCPSARRR